MGGHGTIGTIPSLNIMPVIISISTIQFNSNFISVSNRLAVYR